MGVQPPPIAKPELITLWEPESGKELRTLAGHQGLIQALSFSPIAFLASGSNGQDHPYLGLGPRCRKDAVDWTYEPDHGTRFPKGRHTLGQRGRTTAPCDSDLSNGHEMKSFQAHPNALNGLAFSPDGRLLATSAAGHRVVEIALWNVQTGESRWSLAYTGRYPGRGVFSPDGSQVFAGGGFFSESGLIRIIDVATGRPRLDLLGGKGPWRPFVCRQMASLYSLPALSSRWTRVNFCTGLSRRIKVP